MERRQNLKGVERISLERAREEKVFKSPFIHSTAALLCVGIDMSYWVLIARYIVGLIEMNIVTQAAKILYQHKLLSKSRGSVQQLKIKLFFPEIFSLTSPLSLLFQHWYLNEKAQELIFKSQLLPVRLTVYIWYQSQSPPACERRWYHVQGGGLREKVRTLLAETRTWSQCPWRKKTTLWYMWQNICFFSQNISVTEASADSDCPSLLSYLKNFLIWLWTSGKHLSNPSSLAIQNHCFWHFLVHF